MLPVATSLIITHDGELWPPRCKTSELIHSFNIKNEKSLFETGLFENKYLVGALLLGIFVQTIVVIIPPIAEIFELTNLTMIQWLITVLISVLPIPIMELQKKFDSKHDKNERIVLTNMQKNQL